jgi:hypothetical protein
MSFGASQFRLAFQKKNIHTAAPIFLLLLGMLVTEENATRVEPKRPIGI